jgi:hypothetical protein
MRQIRGNPLEFGRFAHAAERRNRTRGVNVRHLVGWRELGRGKKPLQRSRCVTPLEQHLPVRHQGTNRTRIFGECSLEIGRRTERQADTELGLCVRRLERGRCAQ